MVYEQSKGNVYFADCQAGLYKSNQYDELYTGHPHWIYLLLSEKVYPGFIGDAAIDWQVAYD